METISPETIELTIKYLQLLLDSELISNEQKAEVQYLLNFFTTYASFIF